MFGRRKQQEPSSVTDDVVMIDGEVYDLTEMREHAHQVAVRDWHTLPEKGLALSLIAVIDLCRGKQAYIDRMQQPDPR